MVCGIKKWRKNCTSFCHSFFTRSPCASGAELPPLCPPCPLCPYLLVSFADCLLIQDNKCLSLGFRQLFTLSWRLRRGAQATDSCDSPGPGSRSLPRPPDSATSLSSLGPGPRILPSFVISSTFQFVPVWIWARLFLVSFPRLCSFRGNTQHFVL